MVEGDALKTDAAALGEAPRRIVANLPYNIATPLLLQWLEQADAFASLTLMFQKEVADRLTAQPRTKDYGRLSIVTQWRCTVKQLFDIPPKAFIPPPKVTSTVVPDPGLRGAPRRPALPRPWSRAPESMPWCPVDRSGWRRGAGPPTRRGRRDPPREGVTPVRPTRR